MLEFYSGPQTYKLGLTATHQRNVNLSLVILSPQGDKLFEWVDGPLISAMKNGDMILLDEISLADDSVLERLNSVLETERQITLAESSESLTLTAHEQFRIVATMNPGGDYGKKEVRFPHFYNLEYFLRHV